MPAVSFYVRTHTPDGRRYVPVVFNRSGKAEPHPAGEYTLRYNDPGTRKRRWEPAGSDLNAALNAKSDRERLLRDAEHSPEAAAEPTTRVDGPLLHRKGNHYLSAPLDRSAEDSESLF